MFALLSVWMALGALVTTVVTVATDWPGKEPVVTLLPYTYALAATLAAGVLWAFRQRAADDPGVAGQRLQAMAAIVLIAIALAILLIWANGWFYGLAGWVIEVVFLAICHRGYLRIVRPD
ncbi:MAG: hypothetical protein ACE5F9_08735 [Phycisphaerae bacterium]